METIRSVTEKAIDLLPDRVGQNIREAGDSEQRAIVLLKQAPTWFARSESDQMAIRGLIRSGIVTPQQVQMARQAEYLRIVCEAAGSLVEERLVG